MPTPAIGDEAASYFARLSSMLLSITQLLRSPSAPQTGGAARKLLRQASILMALGAVVIVVLMFGFDVREIGLMPPRGTPSLWPVRVLTGFGKAAFVLWSIAALLIVVTLVAPIVRGGLQSRLLRLTTELQYLLLAVLVPNVAGEFIKWIVGRGRPFVGGHANAFYFSHFAGTSAYASFPSAHAITSAALAFAVAALWPRLRIPMTIYALLIMASRLVLLAHHPSDVVAGALFGVIGAMAVRYWFAAHRLGFAIGYDGAILPSSDPV
ncbi:MAG: phosphatase PAP2 family protein [Bradyrhizobium sp.]|uniref:phosphatase PAP2 family protein n=1 Tax=Bradyrhizobium sp. TaxID=376 RepID=UPI001C29127F|nr:phosphatase PAP2 family protein [Bradyrhizobium sp.]MBU6461806.1 phosphatase PAP2 family protein [Pseudomonadota bacterium]MDE2066128.1 phosphatase PAP2 family protein [Bradyrhizobium sp.]MDE2244200.1 phosphatase PAP2 family protein [Bradyrhizobium sp.]MDE2469889.1 phosphatase PAP2 family protein [Bradyrhizobium sp.]